MKEPKGYKIVVKVEVSYYDSYNTVTVAEKEVKENSLVINQKTPAKEVVRKITELVADTKGSVAEMLYKKEEMDEVKEVE